MPNITITVIGHPGYADRIGKKGTKSDVIFYDLKRGGDTVTLVEPARYPEKLSSLFYAVSLADEVLLVVDEIGPAFGEAIIMLDMVGVSEGYIVLRNFIEIEQVLPLLKGTVAERYVFVDDNPIALRDIFLEKAHGIARSMDDMSPDGIIPVDHSFPVKGIGTVILGVLVKGSIRRHDMLTVLPSGDSVLVRSIQKHDDDCDCASAGDRVGLALKNITCEKLDRGVVLTSNGKVKKTSTISGLAVLSRLWKQSLKPGMVLHIGHWMQFIPARVGSAEGMEMQNCLKTDFILEKDLIYLPGDRAVLHYLDGGKLRIVGKINLE